MRYIAIGIASFVLIAALYLGLTMTVMNSPPEAVILGTYSGNLMVKFNATRSKDPGPPPWPWVGIRRYMWEFGDGETSAEVNPSHTYRQPGTYTVTLRVTDWGGATDQAKVTVTVGDEVEEASFNSESPREFLVVGEDHKNIRFQEWIAETLVKLEDMGLAIDLVALEGMTTPIKGLSYYQDLAQTDPRVAELLKEIARELLRRNIIDGTEYYAIIKVIEGRGPEFVGVEDPELLKAHIDFHTGQDYGRARNRFSNTFDKLMEDLIEILYEKYFNQLWANIKELQDKSEQYRRGEVSSLSYRDYLIQRLQDIGLEELKRRFSQEITIDEKIISFTPDEREQVLSFLRDIFRGEIPPASSEVIRALESCLAFALRVEAEEKIKAGWIAGWIEERVEEEMRGLIKRMESEADRHAKGEISFEDYCSFIIKLIEKYEGLEISSLKGACEGLAPFHSKSMKLVIERNGAMIEKAIGVSKSGDKIFMVVGRTHLAELIRRLRARGYSYYILSPPKDFSSSPDEQRDYFEHFFGFGPSFEEVLKGRIKTPWRIDKPEMKEQIWTQLKVALAASLLKEGKSFKEIKGEIEGLGLPPPDRRPVTMVEEIDYRSLFQFGIRQNIYLTIKLSDGGIALGRADPEGLYTEWVRLRWGRSISREEVDALLKPENEAKRAKLTEALLSQRDKALTDELLDKGIRGQPRSAAIVLEWRLRPEGYAYGIVADGTLKAIVEEQYIGKLPLSREDVSELLSVTNQVTSEDYPEGLMERYYEWYYGYLEGEARRLELEGRESESRELKAYIQEVKGHILKELRELDLRPKNTIQIPGIWIRDLDGRERILPPTPDGFVLIDAPEPLLEYLSEMIPPEAILVGVAPGSTIGDLNWKMAETIELNEVTFLYGPPYTREGPDIESLRKTEEELRLIKTPINFKNITDMSPEEFLKEIGEATGVVVVLGHIPKESLEPLKWPKGEVRKKELKEVAEGKVIFGFLSCFAEKANFAASVVEGKALLSFGPFKELKGQKVLDALKEIAREFKKEKMSLKEFVERLMEILKVTSIQEESPIIIEIDMELPDYSHDDQDILAVGSWPDRC